MFADCLYARRKYWNDTRKIKVKLRERQWDGGGGEIKGLEGLSEDKRERSQKGER